ncbi:MAG: hypothetical protein KF830_16355 [Planctomycetes bacterium]|nr:hypothetical protein [Planctomycetota bacterium]
MERTMEANRTRVPWWYFALTGLAIAAVLGLLLSRGAGWPVQIGAVMVLLLGLLVVIRRSRLSPNKARQPTGPKRPAADGQGGQTYG